MLFVWTELRRSVRSLSKSPALAAVAIFSLALGIGFNVTVYSVAREMILDVRECLAPRSLSFRGRCERFILRVPGPTRRRRV